MSGIMNMFVAAKTAVAAAVDEFFNRVTLLLNTGSTNGAQNNTFLDSSTANAGSGWTITRNGNTTQGTFTPFSQTGWSNYFDGNGDQLSVGNVAAAQTGANDFSIECFVYAQKQTNTYAQGLVSYGISGSTTGTSYLSFQISATGYLSVVYAQGTTATLTDSTLFPLNQWVHAVVCRSGSTLSLFVNGTRVATASTSATVGNTGNALIIGGQWYANDTLRQLQGYLSNVRIVNGASAYNAASSTITVPTSALTAITSTSLLTCQSNRFVDNSSNTYSITPAGNSSVQAFSPFAPTAAYSTTTVGGSGYFDGSADYLQNPAAASNGVGTGNYTLECWFYLNSAPASGSERTFIRYHWTGSTGQNAVYYLSVTNSSGTLYPFTYARDVTNSANNTSITSNTAIRLYTWNHVAAVRSGTTLTLYLNGVSVGSATGVSWNITSATNIPIYIGTYNGSSEMMDGYILGARVVKSAVYSGSTYTIPTAPPTSDANTQLLLNFTNAGIYDAAAKNALETVGNAQVSTTQAKFGTTSMYFDGTGDYLTIPNSSIVNLSGDFTIEAWVYRVTTGANTNILCVGSFAASANGFAFYISSTNYLAMFGNNAVIAIGSTTTIPANTWTYVAAVRSGTGTNNLKLYVNGTLEVQATNNTSFVGVAANGMSVGAYYDGSAFTATASCYIDELRLTRYARTITTPTAAFPVQ